MYCTKCGTPVDPGEQRYCSTCGTAAPSDPAAGPAAVSKGLLLAVGLPSVQGYREVCRALIVLGVAVICYGVWQGLGALVFLFSMVPLGGVISLLAPQVILRTVRIYENGLERDLARSWNECMFLPWREVQDYRWEGNVLRYSWRENGILLFRSGRSESCEPLTGVKPGIFYDFFQPSFYYGFPNAIQVPDDKADLVRGVLARGLKPTAAR